jgi:hypothetical protein
VTKIEEYRRRAAECAAMAEAAANTHEREIFTYLQRSWSRLARNLTGDADTIPSARRAIVHLADQQSRASLGERPLSAIR